MANQIRQFLFRSVRRNLSILVDMEVNNANERYAISEALRKEGFVCRQLNTDQFFILDGGIDNKDWVLFDLKLIINSDGKYADKHYSYPINHQTEVIIQHNLRKRPSVTLMDEDGNICIPATQHIDENHTKIATHDPFTGVAIFN